MVKGIIMDVDGVVWIAGRANRDAISLFGVLQEIGIPFVLLTNDCSISKSERHARLSAAGIPVSPIDLIMATEVVGKWLRIFGIKNILYLGSPNAAIDLGDQIVFRDYAPVEAVVCGDLFDHFDRAKLDCAVSAIDLGAKLIAIHANKVWFDGKTTRLDNGFWVAGLEYATSEAATVLGKPNEFAYQVAIERLCLGVTDLSQIWFVSDDCESDLRGAKLLGLTTVYFGKASTTPSWVNWSIESLEDLNRLIRSSRP